MIFTVNKDGYVGSHVGMRELKELCLQLLRKIAISETFEEYTEAVKELKSHEIWALPKAAGFREWVEKTCLSTYKVRLSYCYYCY